MPLYDCNGKVDGFEFILTFYHLRFENRGVQHTSRVDAEKRLRDNQITSMERKCTLNEEKNAINLLDEVIIICEVTCCIHF